MKKLILVIAMVLMACTSNAQYVTWDFSPEVLNDGQVLVFRHTDPASDGVAFVVYQTMNTDRGMMNVFYAVYSRERGYCYYGTRTISNNQSDLIKNQVPCTIFNNLETSYQRSREPKTKPLEELEDEEMSEVQTKVHDKTL